MGAYVSLKRLALPTLLLFAYSGSFSGFSSAAPVHGQLYALVVAPNKEALGIDCSK